MFDLNQIVKGKKAGVFVIVGFRKIDGVDCAQVKSVNPADHSQASAGEMALELTSIESV